MITDEEVIAKYNEYAFGTNSLIPFARAIYHLGRHQQRESDAALCKSQADRSNASGEKEREFGSSKTAQIYFDTATGAEFCCAAVLANIGELK